MRYPLWLCVFAGAVSLSPAKTFYVEVDGIDSPERDGLSVSNGWASLAYACQQVPVGTRNTILLGGGTFVASEPAFPRVGTTIEGKGFLTRLEASPDWAVPDDPERADHMKHSLVCVIRQHHVSLKSISFRCQPDHRAVASTDVGAEPETRSPCFNPTTRSSRNVVRISP